MRMGPYDRDTLSFRDNCSQWGSCRRSKESCPNIPSFNWLHFVNQNNIKKNISKRGNLAVVDFKLSIKQKRERGIQIFSPKKLDVIFKCSKKGGKRSYSQPQSSLKGQIWKRNPVNCCSQRNFIYLNENGRRANLCVMYSNEAKQVVINPGFIPTSIILPNWIIISYIHVITPHLDYFQLPMSG